MRMFNFPDLTNAHIEYNSVCLLQKFVSKEESENSYEIAGQFWARILDWGM